MDIHYTYAKAYMKERLERANAQRLAAEVARVESDRATARRWNLGLVSPGQRLDPSRIRLVERRSPEAVCCTT